MSSCFGRRRPSADDLEPLLPRYRDDTALQRALHQKLHSYQMLRALRKGFMPSNEQAIVALRTALAADVLQAGGDGLSGAGRLLVGHAREWLRALIELLRHKNGGDQLQDFVWCLSRSSISVDVDDISRAAQRARAKADAAAAYRSLQTVGSLLLANSDLRLLLLDLNVVAREVFRDAAFALSDAADDAGRQLAPSAEAQQALRRAGADEALRSSGEDPGRAVADASRAVGDGVAAVAEQARESVADKASGDSKDALLWRWKQAVLGLRHRRDYADSVSTISLLLRRYALVYSRAAKDTVSAAQEDVDTNPEADRALANFWSLLTSFGCRHEWDELERRIKTVMDHRRSDAEFEHLMTDAGDALEQLLTDPAFFDHAGGKLRELRDRFRRAGPDTPLRQDVDRCLGQIQAAVESALRDDDVARLLRASARIASMLSPAGSYVHGDLVADSVDFFVPLLVRAVQHVPIPRLEIATPDIDLLLESLVLEPGTTVNRSSFLPYRLRVESYNDLEIRKARFRTTSSVASRLTIKLDGLSVRADEVGYWLRAHSGILRLADEGIASFELDERGIDIHMDVEIGKETLEKMLVLKAVRVRVHKLSYSLRQSKFSFLGWLFKPLVRPVIRRAIERRLAAAVADGIHAANRELLYARERLRATRISDPDDLWTFLKAVAARLVPAEDPDLYARIGIAQPGEGVFKGVYAPGSLVKLWNEEAASAGERVDGYDQGGWRNDIFDIHTQAAA